ncbi:MAG: hypothetical protein ACKV2V_26445, partial [Blastocatellia bacterium]
LISDGFLYAGGSFTRVGEAILSAPSLARLNLAAGAWSALGAGAGTSGLPYGPDVRAMGLAPNGLLAGGNFTQLFDSTTAVINTRLLGVWRETGWALPFGPELLGRGAESIDSVAPHVDVIFGAGEDIYLGGHFHYIGGIQANNLVRWNTRTGQWSALGTPGPRNGLSGGGFSGTAIRAMAIIGNDLYVAGSFDTAYNGAVKLTPNNIARLNLATGQWSELGAPGLGNGLTGPAHALLAVGTDLYAGGAFGGAYNSPFQRDAVLSYGIARWDTARGLWVNTHTTGAGLNSGPVYALARQGDFILAGGSFDTVVTPAGVRTAASNLARINLTTQDWSVYGSGAAQNANGVNDEVLALAPAGQDLYVGGAFTAANRADGTQLAAGCIARWNAASGAWATLGTEPGAGVTSGSGFVAEVRAIATRADEVYVTGIFNTARSRASAPVTAGNIAMWNAVSGAWSPLDAGLSTGYVAGYTLAVTGEGLLVGGSFQMAGDKSSLDLARYLFGEMTLARTAIAVNNVSAAFSATAQTIALRAAVSSQNAVGEGAVVFTLRNNTGVIGLPLTVPVTGGTANGNYVLPAGTPAGSYTIDAAYVGTDQFAASQGNGILTVSIVNTTPVILAAAAPTAQQGSAATSVLLATVSDAETPATGLTVTVRDAPAGVNIGPPVNNNGAITASVQAACAATTGARAITVQVTDAGGLSAAVPLTINVTANTPPNPGRYNAVTLTLNANTAITPAQAPTDNGAINGITATAPGFTGGLLVNPATGVISVSSAGPAGKYQVSVTAADNCGAPGNTTFELIVARPVASVSAASYATGMAAEQIVSAFGVDLATASVSASTLPLPLTLGGTTAQIRDSQGVTRPVPLFFVSPSQVNYLVPAGTASGAATLIINSASGAISQGAVQISAVAPGLFTADSSGTGLPAAQFLRVRPNNTLSYEPVARYDDQLKRFVGIPVDLGGGDKFFLILYGTGIRNLASQAGVSVRIAGVSVPVAFAGAQGDLLGLDQINVELPVSLAGRGQTDVAVTVDGKAANTVSIVIR